MVEDDAVFKYSELRVREPGSFVAYAWNLFKIPDQVVGKIADEAPRISLTGVRLPRMSVQFLKI